MSLISRRCLIASVISAPALTRLGYSQFSTSVKVINVLATVRDKDGKIVHDLTKDDFSLSEDGKDQTIQYFSQQSDLPLTLGLLIDTSGSERRNIPTEKDASYKFLESVLRPEKDKAFIIHFDREVELLQDLTSSRTRLKHALDNLQSTDAQQVGSVDKPNSNGPESTDPNQQRGQGSNGGTWGGIGSGWPTGGGGLGGSGRGHGGMGRGSGYPNGGTHGGMHGGGTKFFDAVYLAADDILQKQPGRKAIIMLTDGEDNGSKESLDSAIHTAQRAEMLAYSIHIADTQSSFGRSGSGGGSYGGRGGNFERPDGKKILRQISKETGAGYFEFKKSLDEIYHLIDEELRNQYSIGYTPATTQSNGSFHKIDLTVKQKGFIVQARDGYYS